MTQEQFLAIIRAVAPAALAYVVGKGWVASDAVGGLTAAAVTVASAIWAGVAHSNPSLVAKVAAMPGTSVSDHGTTIKVLSPALADAAAAHATPAN